MKILAGVQGAAMSPLHGGAVGEGDEAFAAIDTNRPLIQGCPHSPPVEGTEDRQERTSPFEANGSCVTMKPLFPFAIRQR